MQTVSSAYKKSISGALRNRAYIRAYLGVINSKAQQNISADDKRNSLAYFSNIYEPLYGEGVQKPYATAEQDFSAVDGSMYFLPDEDSGYEYYNNGIVTDQLCGSIYFNFGVFVGLDIKGLTIDFGDCYPTEFTVQNLVEEPDGLYLRDNKNNIMVYIHDPSAICQCTRLKDKNGNLIWENDILMCHGNKKDLCKVCFGEFKVIDIENMVAVDIVQGWYYRPLKTDGLSKCEPFCYEMPLTNYYLERMEAEVIGSAIDNPELLEVGE